VRKVLQEFDDRSRAQRSRQERLRLIAQGDDQPNANERLGNQP
jgi:Na+/H+ antiporter NhaB